MAAKKLPKDALLTEILQKVSSAKTKKEKVDLLNEYNSQALRSLLIINFDDSLTDRNLSTKRNHRFCFLKLTFRLLINIFSGCQCAVLREGLDTLCKRFRRSR